MARDVEKHSLTYEELFKIGFVSQTTRRCRVSEDGNVHVLRLTTDWTGTLHGDLTMWLIYSKESLGDIKALWKSVTKEGERTDGRVAFYDLGDAKELPIILEILMLSDGKLNFGCYDYSYRKKESARGYLGFIVGNGGEIDLDSNDLQGLIACILANHIGPKTEFLSDATDRVERVISELERQGVHVSRGAA